MTRMLSVPIPWDLYHQVKATCGFHGWKMRHFVEEALAEALRQAHAEGLYVAPPPVKPADPEGGGCHRDVKMGS
jgi:hypothetical protein